MRPNSLLILPIISILLGGCFQLPWSTDSDAPETTSSTAVNKLAGTPPRSARSEPESGGSYRLDAGDRVRVVVSGQDTLSKSYEVGANGAIELPAIGKVSARGLNAVQLSAAIARRLKQSNVSDAHVAVQIETYRPISIYGDVANPGKYPYVNNMTTETAIEMAGGLKGGGEKSAVTVSNRASGGPKAPVATGSISPGDTVTVMEER